MKKIIIIQHEPLTPNIEKKYCLKELIVAGFSLEYWDISQIIYPGLTVANSLEYNYLRIVKTFDELKSLWDNLSDDCIAIPEFFFIPKTGRIWKLLSSRKIPLVKIERYANTNIGRTFLQKIISHANPKSAYQYLENFIFRFSMRFAGISTNNRYDYYLTSGNKIKCDCQINHPDYDDYLLHKNDESFLKEKYICFIDTGFGIHPDQKFYRTDIHEDNELWQAKLSVFFSIVEKKYGIPVVIAVHPKLEYPENAFDGRKKIKYQTLNLVKNAEFVLQDISNSIAFSVIENKKIGLITTNEFWKIYNQHLTQMSKILDIPVFNIDKQDMQDFEPVALKATTRISYMNSYLCSEETKDKLTSDILIDFFRKL